MTDKKTMPCEFLTHVAPALAAARNPDSTRKYRTGVVCEVGGVVYWHTGAQYWLAVDSANGSQIDLRELKGFKAMADSYSRSTALCYDSRWMEIADAEPEIAKAVAVLRERAELLWWELVCAFLNERHAAISLRTKASGFMSGGGMSDLEIKTVLAG